MKCTYLTVALALSVMLLASACNTEPKNQNAIQDHHEKHEKNEMGGEDKSDQFAHIEFASKYDTICGMPIKAGIADTLMHDGKIYGFCATECKEEFKKMLAKQP